MKDGELVQLDAETFSVHDNRQHCSYGPCKYDLDRPLAQGKDLSITKSRTRGLTADQRKHLAADADLWSPSAD